jgi:FkbM family methyltransferase
MRIADFTDYWTLRGIAENPWEIVRFRKRGRRSNAPRELEVRFLDGRSFFLRAGQTDFHVFNRIFVRDEYELDPVRAGSWDTVIDIGANVGTFACRVAKNARRVICFEPAPASFAQLERNTRQFEGVEAVREAVAGAPGLVRLHRPRDGRQSDSFTFFPEPGLGAEGFDDADEVTATTLDALLVKHGVDRCDLLKIDAEGAEYEIFHATSDATLARIQRITGEYHDVQPDDPRTRIAHFAAHLESKGFAVETKPSKRRRNHGLFFARRR